MITLLLLILLMHIQSIKNLKKTLPKFCPSFKLINSSWTSSFDLKPHNKNSLCKIKLFLKVIPRTY